MTSRVADRKPVKRLPQRRVSDQRTLPVASTTEIVVKLALSSVSDVSLVTLSYSPPVGSARIVALFPGRVNELFGLGQQVIVESTFPAGSDAKNQQIADGLSEGFLGNAAARQSLHHAPGCGLEEQLRDGLM